MTGEQISVSLPHEMGSLIHWRMVAGFMNYLGYQDSTSFTSTDQQVPLTGILYGDVVDAHCHLQEFLQNKEQSLETYELRKMIYNYGLKFHQM